VRGPIADFRLANRNGGVVSLADLCERVGIAEIIFVHWAWSL
jgi:hypothetical protein